MTDGGPVREHYASEGITERVLTALRTNGPDVPITPETLAPIDHFHGKGVIATEELVIELQLKASDNLLDVGCGIDGPARWIAVEFCAPARELKNLPGLADRVGILPGDMLSLPAPNNSFDHADSQAALMNISDKRGASAKPFACFAPAARWPYHWPAPARRENPATRCRGPPRPQSVSSLRQMKYAAICFAAGFQIVSLRDTSAALAEALPPILNQLETEGLPPLGEHIVTGENAKEWRINWMRSMAEQRLSMIEVLAREPA